MDGSRKASGSSRCGIWPAVLLQKSEIVGKVAIELRRPLRLNGKLDNF